MHLLLDGITGQADPVALAGVTDDEMGRIIIEPMADLVDATIRALAGPDAG
ncbi:hypothetical protein [Methylobacterium nigriterrae]|uniref:hypothetical protein n=1 Tax=Methylobacterium nigriterrae TaxID=3127512 RepID=UPI00301414E2